MDPQKPTSKTKTEVQYLQDREERGRIVVSQPYSSTKQVTEDLIKQLQTKLEWLAQNNKQLYCFEWKWASNGLSAAQIDQIVGILPKSVEELCISGSTELSATNLQNILKKFAVNLTKLNLCVQFAREEAIKNGENDLNYQIEIKNSMKNFRQRTKWCCIVNKDRKFLQQKVIVSEIMPKNLKILNLQGITIGGNTNTDVKHNNNNNNNCLQTILTSCPNVNSIDLSRCQLIDQHFSTISPAVLKNFQQNIQELRLICNRLTLKSIQAIFPLNQQYENVRILDVSLTNMTEAGNYEYIIGVFPNLVEIGLGSLIVESKQIIEAHQKKGRIWKQLLVLNLDSVFLQTSALQVLLNSCLTLKSLSLFDAQIEQDSTSLADILPLGIQYANLCNVSVVDDSFLKTFLPKHEKTIKILKLSGTKITAEGLQNLSQLPCEFLEWLQISNLDSLYLIPKGQEQILQEEKIKKEIEENKMKKQKVTNELLPPQITEETVLESLKKMGDPSKRPNLQYLEAFNILSKKETKQELVSHLQKRGKGIYMGMDGEGPGWICM